MDTFAITGPGEYRARDGLKVTIAGPNDGAFSDKYPWRGFRHYSDGEAKAYEWCADGRFTTASLPSDADIVAPWIEPATLDAVRAGVDAEVAASVAGAIETFTPPEPDEPIIDAEFVESKSVEAYAVETVERVGARVEEHFGAAEGRPVNAPTERLDWPDVHIPVADPDAEEEPTDYRECAEVLAAALRVLCDAVDASIPRGAHGLKLEDARRLATVALDGFAP